MPSNITHMLICHKAMNYIRKKGIKELNDFANLIESKEYQSFLNMGSLGPDMFYYFEISKSIKDFLFDSFTSSKGVEPWSYHLHSVNPNKFPLKLIEILFRDVKDSEIRFIDIARLSFITGYLTHIAADQIIHPIVNKIAGPYYREGKNREEHRKAEIFQDFFIYESVYRIEGKKGKRYDFFSQNFNEWIDMIKKPTTKNTNSWFRNFIQRGFAETYYIFPDDDIIEDSVDNLLLTLRAANIFKPYKQAYQSLKNKNTNSDLYKRYISDVNYLNYYRKAIELSLIYILALFELFLILKNEFNLKEELKLRFLSIINNADLTCPLKPKLLNNSIKALKSDKFIDKRLYHFYKNYKDIKFYSEEEIDNINNNKELISV